MAFPENDVYNLKNIRINFMSGVKLDVMVLRYKRNPIYIPRKPGSALVGSQWYNGEDFPELSVRVINGPELHVAQLTPNDPIDTFTALSTETGTPSVFPAEFATKFPPGSMVLGGVGTEFGGDAASEVDIPIVTNVLNPNVVV